jgi:hypothetical protein
MSLAYKRLGSLMNLAYERLGSLMNNIHLAYAKTRAAGEALMAKFTQRESRSPPDVALH